jgi:hypothetical protein
MHRPLHLLLLLVVLSGCARWERDAAGAPASLREARGDDAYVDVESWFSTGPEGQAWHRMEDALKQEFDDICGDTFCEGDYNDIEPISFTCSVCRATGEIGSCVWVFGGSYEDIEPSSGAIDVHAKIFSCQIPIQATPDELVNALGTHFPLDQPLPHAKNTVYDVLVDCLRASST